jgi:hypothetical protein
MVKATNFDCRCVAFQLNLAARYSRRPVMLNRILVFILTWSFILAPYAEALAGRRVP